MRLGTKAQYAVYVVLMGLILLNAPAYWFWVRPEIEAGTQEREEVKAVRLELHKRLTLVTTLKQLEARLEDSRKTYAEFTRDYIFPYGQAASELLRELEGICTEAGLSRNQASYRASSESQFGMQQINITLPIEGSYPNVRKFLNTLENSERFIIIDSVALESEREGSGLIRLDLQLSTLFNVRP
ncbi:MAG: type 4a pilus biogenesis protein PilO [Acidobacteriota bacterium]